MIFAISLHCRKYVMNTFRLTLAASCREATSVLKKVELAFDVSRCGLDISW